MGMALDHKIMASCSTCQREIPSDAPGGLCPVCAFGMARSQGKNPADQPTREMTSNFPEQLPTPELLSRMLPQFEVQELIGIGGMGAVYRARQPKLDRPIALKIMSSRFAKQPAFAERFAREARLLARLNHPHIVSVYDFGEVNGFCYLVMEFVDGINLRQAISAGKLPADEVLQIVQQVCEALQFAHDQGVVHRDIKPENILLDQRGRVKIADFGLAKLNADPQTPVSLTGTQQVLGTFNYMAPEQLEKPGSVDHRADIYSLGVVLYELLTGELPIGRFPLPGEKQSQFAPLDQVVARTLEKEPQRRYQQASEVQTAVEVARSDSRFQPVQPAGGRRPAATPFVTQTPPAAAQPYSSPSVAEAVVPFRIGNPSTGYKTQTDGMLSLQKDELVITYSARDPFFNTKLLGHDGEHRLPLSQISAADFKEGWFAHPLTIKHRSLEDYRGLITDKRGSLKFVIASEDIDDAKVLVNRIRGAIGQSPIANLYEKPQEKRSRAKRRLHGLGIAMSLVGFVNTALFPALMIALFSLRSGVPSMPPDPSVPEISQPLESNEVTETSTSESEEIRSALKSGMQRTELEERASASPSKQDGVSDRPAVTNVQKPAQIMMILTTAIFFGIGLLLLSGAHCLLNVRHWHWAIAMSILCLIPIHPGAIVGGIVVGIWSLVELCRYSNRVAFTIDPYES